MEPEQRVLTLPVWIKTIATTGVAWWNGMTPASKTAFLIGFITACVVGFLLA